MGSDIVTFTGSKVEKEINNVGAALVAERWAQIFGEPNFKKRVRRDSKGFSVQTTTLYAFLRFNVSVLCLRFNLRSPARVSFFPAPLHTLLQHAPFSLPRHRKCTRVLTQTLAFYLPWNFTAPTCELEMMLKLCFEYI